MHDWSSSKASEDPDDTHLPFLGISYEYMLLVFIGGESDVWPAVSDDDDDDDNMGTEERVDEKSPFIMFPNTAACSAADSSNWAIRDDVDWLLPLVDR